MLGAVVSYYAGNEQKFYLSFPRLLRVKGGTGERGEQLLIQQEEIRHLEGRENYWWESGELEPTVGGFATREEGIFKLTATRDKGIRLWLREAVYDDESESTRMVFKVKPAQLAHGAVVSVFRHGRLVEKREIKLAADSGGEIKIGFPGRWGKEFDEVVLSVRGSPILALGKWAVAIGAAWVVQKGLEKLVAVLCDGKLKLRALMPPGVEGLREDGEVTFTIPVPIYIGNLFLPRFHVETTWDKVEVYLGENSKPYKLYNIGSMRGRWNKAHFVGCFGLTQMACKPPFVHKEYGVKIKCFREEVVEIVRKKLCLLGKCVGYREIRKGWYYDETDYIYPWMKEHIDIVEFVTQGQAEIHTAKKTGQVYDPKTGKWLSPSVLRSEWHLKEEHKLVYKVSYQHAVQPLFGYCPLPQTARHGVSRKCVVEVWMQQRVVPHLIEPTPVATVDGLVIRGEDTLVNPDRANGISVTYQKGRIIPLPF
jgi:hypothetical protein